VTLRLLELATPAFIPPDRWPPKSPDLNPVDYKIWSVIQQRVYQSWVHNVDELKQRLVHVWHGINQTIDNAILMSGTAVFVMCAGEGWTL